MHSHEDNFRFENLDLWHKSINFAKEVYSVIRDLPPHNSNKDFAHYLNVARGSPFEAISQLNLAYKLRLYSGSGSTQNLQRRNPNIQDALGV